MIPEVSHETIVKAMEQFDKDLRDSQEWHNWDQKGNFLNAIEFNGRLYPVKKIISMAAQVSVGTFSGGHPAQDYLRRKGFSIVRMRERKGEDPQRRTVLRRSQQTKPDTKNVFRPPYSDSGFGPLDMKEKDLEDAIAENPEKYLQEKGLSLIARQYRIGSYIFDLLFQDRHGAKLIVEIQKGALDRNHTYKILDYYDEYKEQNPSDFIELMVVANKIPHERRRRLKSLGIAFKEIPIDHFMQGNQGDNH